MEIHTIGIDLGKTVFHLVGLNPRGEVVVRKKCSRNQILRFTSNLRVSLIGMEACGGAHFLGRALREQRHDVRLMPAQYVKPYVKTNKNDYIDAEAIAEAVTRPSMRFVPIKTEDQLDLPVSSPGTRAVGGASYRGDQPDSWIAARARHHGEEATPPHRRVAARNPGGLRQQAFRCVAGTADRVATGGAVSRRQIEESDKLILRIASELEPCRRLLAIPGIGPVIATATVAAIGDGAAFKKGRGVAAWLGVVPGEHSTGGKQKLTGTSRLGNKYLRKLFVQVTRARYGGASVGCE
jgi:transposase